jgi:hypothetical protein
LVEVKSALPDIGDPQQNPVVSPAKVEVFCEIHEQPFSVSMEIARESLGDTDSPATGVRISDSLAAGWRIWKVP